MNQATHNSADPMLRKQALAIAESLLEEITLMPFTFCDPDDTQAASAQSPIIGPAGCASVIESLGPEPGETRYAAMTPFDNVNDYHNFFMNSENGGIRDISSTAINGLDSYAASVTITPTEFEGIAAADSLLITVTVIQPNMDPLVLQGYRTRYSPRTTP